MVRKLWNILSGTIVGMLLVCFALPMACGFLSFATTFGGSAEQEWLDDVTNHLRELRSDCDDPELDAVLEYTIRRYSHISPFHVAISRCDWYPLGDPALGLNNPLVPGVTLDLSLLHQYPIHTGAKILVHEALHDYPPYLGHGHIYPVLDKLENHYVQR